MLTHVADVEAWLQGLLLADMRLAELVQGRVASVPGLTGQRQERLEQSLRALFTQLPALGTYVPEGRWAETQPGYQTEDLSAWVLCAALNARGPGFAARGDRFDLGAWDLVEHVRRACTGQGSVQNIESVTPVGWKLLWANQQLAVCAVELGVILLRPVVLVDQPQGWSGSGL